ncbi:LytR/AlgR family response regulator transcription factor [Pseudoalteromonas tetraodonis]|uniref:LytR/AlgR family response regulator transcription factor n=1 Tax=Pseudoalteromonas tetraodonis TaxID=43659 RepID=UPI003A96BF4F
MLLLDIQMPELTGLELLASLQNKPLVIFTTAFPEYAVEGFQLDAIDYLVKPVMFPRFLKAVNKASKQVQYLQQVNTGFPPIESSTETPPTEPGYIFVKVDSRWERIQLANITYIESCGDYIIIHQVANEASISLQTLTQMNSRLTGKGFVRVHRSYIVNLAKVDTVEKDHLLIGNVDISIGKSYRQEFIKLVSERD